MLRLTEIRLPLDHDAVSLQRAAAQLLGIDIAQLRNLRIRRRGYDARGGKIRFVYTVDVEVDDESMQLRRNRSGRVGLAPDETYRYPVVAPAAPSVRPVIVGAGPCGLFAALSLARMGLRPILLERGRDVRTRARDVWRFWRHREFNPDSNVQFGEGGAGTFSDGKLHSGIKDREHRVKKVLLDLVECGAPPEIEWISKPHIGTLRLVKVVEGIRRRLTEAGGEIRFQANVTGLRLHGNRVRGVELAGGEHIASDHVVLAVGHSARDIFEMLERSGVALEAKPFSIGFRIEHPQSLIDRARLGQRAGHPELGAADYKLVYHARNGRSVYSFCMCPGGQVVAAASEAGRVVTNGMSHYSRNERNANAGIVVGVTPEDFGGAGPLAGVEFQRRLEQQAFELGGRNYNAPAQRVGDFIAGQRTAGPGSVVPSYTPGVTWTDLSSALPTFAVDAIREALVSFNRDLRGFAMADAVLTGVEVRTSSPVRIPRDEESLESTSTRGLYPAGEGAGYAGGIMSAAVDGMRVAEQVAQVMVSNDVRPSSG